MSAVTVADLREVLTDPDLPPDTPVRVQIGYRVSTWEWQLQGAHATLAGPGRRLVLELRAVTTLREAAP